MHALENDVAHACLMNSVRARYAQKQWTRTSLSKSLVLWYTQAIAGVRYFSKFFPLFGFECFSIHTLTFATAFRMIYDIPQAISFNWYVICDLDLYSDRLKNMWPSPWE